MDVEDFPGAEAVHRRILAKRLTLADTDRNAEVANSLQNLAAALLPQQRYAEAESLAVRAGGIYRAVLPEGHYLPAFPLLTLSKSQLLRGDGGAAEVSSRSAVRVLRAALPEGHFATAAAECRLGAALASQSRHAEAEPLLRAAFERLEQNEQTPARFLRECGGALADLYDATGRTDQGRRYREAAGR